MSDTFAVLCASCRVSPEPTSNDHAQEWRCPKCGASDKREAIFEDAKAHAVEVAQRKLNDGMAKAAKGSKFLKFTPASIPPRRYKWVTDVKM